MHTTASNSDPTSRRVPPRFSWPLRVFLFLIVFDMVFRGFMVLVPISTWREELDMERLPRRLPTRAEIRDMLTHEGSQKTDTLTEDVFKSLDSVWEFWKPWPNAAIRSKIAERDSWERTGKYAICWLSTRCEFLEAMCGIDQEWPMFSPNVSRRRWVSRARLCFDDGSERFIRQTADPEDLTNYSHWNQEKVLDYELHVSDDDETATFGWCNLLAHRHPRDENGSPLTKITIFMVRYDFPPPGADVREFLRGQTGPPGDQVYPPYYEYDARERRGTMLPRKP